MFAGGPSTELLLLRRLGDKKVVAKGVQIQGRCRDPGRLCGDSAHGPVPPEEISFRTSSGDLFLASGLLITLHGCTPRLNERKKTEGKEGHVMQKTASRAPGKAEGCRQGGVGAQSCWELFNDRRSKSFQATGPPLLSGCRTEGSPDRVLCLLS